MPIEMERNIVLAVTVLQVRYCSLGRLYEIDTQKDIWKE